MINMSVLGVIIDLFNEVKLIGGVKVVL